MLMTWIQVDDTFQAPFITILQYLCVPSKPSLMEGLDRSQQAGKCIALPFSPETGQACLSVLPTIFYNSSDSTLRMSPYDRIPYSA